MELPGWTQAISPFHAGEQAVQARMGVSAKSEKIGRRFIRDFMPDQHREFYEALPFILVGSLDQEGRPWASILTGKPNFITASDSVTLNFKTQFSGDNLGGKRGGDRQKNHLQSQLKSHLKLNANVGFLGIDLATRRRNRVNGKVKAIAPDYFSVQVTQSFGNCPQFIQQRHLQWLPEQDSKNQEQTLPEIVKNFTPSMVTLIQNIDSFFIATSFSDPGITGNQGVDISHRGGKPGFVKIEGDRQFIFPNFSGNNFYNTLGNLQQNNLVGILFVDFQTGDLISLTGTAEIIWEGTALANFKGAEQLIRITAEEIISMPNSLPFHWELIEYSPANSFVGDWDS